MGTGKLNTAVADAGPLIHLSEIGCLSVMCIFDIFVTHAIVELAIEQIHSHSDWHIPNAHIPYALCVEALSDARFPRTRILLHFTFL